MKPARRGGQRGMTLLELLIVLLMMSLLMGLAAPRVTAQLESARQRALQRQLRAVVEDLPLRAFRSGEPMDVTSRDLLQMLGADWPSSMRIALAQPLRYGRSGIAGGGVIEVTESGRAPIVWNVEPVSGRLLVLSQAPSHAN